MRILKFALFTSLLALALTGCNREQPSPTTPAGPSTPGEITHTPTPMGTATQISQADLDAIPKASKPYKIVLIVKTKNNPFFIPMIQAFEATAKEMGAVGEVQAAAQETSYEQQVSLVQNEVSKGMQAILITPADSKALVPALKKAQDAGVLVINLDNRLDPESMKEQGLNLGGYVGADNEAGGKKAGEAMLAALSGKGKVVILEGIRSADNAQARKRGFESAVKGKMDIVDSESAEWDTEKAYAKTLALLAKHTDLAGIFCANDNMAIGAMRAVSEKGLKGKITVVGYDNIPGVRKALDSGEMKATIEQHPESMGMYGVRMAIGLLDKKIQPGGEMLVNLDTIVKK